MIQVFIKTWSVKKKSCNVIKFILKVFANIYPEICEENLFLK